MCSSIISSLSSANSIRTSREAWAASANEGACGLTVFHRFLCSFLCILRRANCRPDLSPANLFFFLFFGGVSSTGFKGFWINFSSSAPCSLLSSFLSSVIEPFSSECSPVSELRGLQLDIEDSFLALLWRPELMIPQSLPNWPCFFYNLPVMGSALIGGKLDLLDQSTNTCRAELLVPPTWPSHISIIHHRHCSNRWKIKHP